MSSADEPIRVLVCASDAKDLAQWESMLHDSDSLHLVASVLGHEGLDPVVESSQPDVIVDQAWGESSDPEAPLESADSQPRTILLVSDSQVAEALVALRSNTVPVLGLLPAWSSEWEIRAAIHAVAEGLIVLHPHLADRILEDGGRATAPARNEGSAGHPLSPREREILNLLADGLGNKQIAGQLHISEHTVKFHVTSIFNKLNASSRAEAVAIGARQGLILL